MRKSEGKGYRVTAVVRATAVLDLLASEGPLTVSQITSKLRLPRTSTFHLIKTLESTGLIRWIPEGNRYTLGLRIVDLSSRALGQLDIRRIAHPHLVRLSGQSGETSHLQVLELQTAEVVCIDRIESREPLQVRAWIGKRNPWHATASGKVFAAYASAEDLRYLLDDHTLQRPTPSTRHGREQLLRELEEVRGRGYAFNDEELMPGIRAVAAPILQSPEVCLAAVSLIGPTTRMTDDRMRELAAAVADTARSIAIELGARGVGDAPSGAQPDRRGLSHR
ncbi:MAG TPA: IclR family transcriptional regulator [Candidatus Dormibacteraeota bacterium]|nr:IclR family transcriptional regulator [Candidatus Dormibacteraeota bacterium]